MTLKIWSSAEQLSHTDLNANFEAVKNEKLVVIGETIAGGTVPVAAYQSAADTQYYTCDANDTAKLQFQGFITSSGVDNDTETLKFQGIVGGFSGLTPNAKCYVQNDGTIGHTAGTYEILVGIAVSATEILILKGKRIASGYIDSGTASGNSVITTGFRASKIRLWGMAGSSSKLSILDTTWVNGVMMGVGALYNEGSSGGSGDSVFFDNSTSEYMTYSITNLTDTTFRIDWTETGSVGNSQRVYYVAEGDI